jgi:hypothetical protein
MGRRYSLVFFRVNFSFCLRVVATSLVLTLPPFFLHCPDLFFSLFKLQFSCVQPFFFIGEISPKIEI